MRALHVWDFHRTTGLCPDVQQQDGLHLLSLRAEPLESPINSLLKRALDLAVAVPVVFLVLPVISTFVWIVQRFQSPGPLFFAQQRTGQNGQFFWMVKFRTMHVDNPDESRQATDGDPRIYPLGRYLRKFSIDEVPQFVNVLMGNMSLVGPRPHLPEHDERFARLTYTYRVRTFVKPGITGLAQVRGFRGLVLEPSDITQRVDSDLHYLENWSIFLDILILLRTIKDVIRPPKSAA